MVLMVDVVRVVSNMGNAISQTRRADRAAGRLSRRIRADGGVGARRARAAPSERYRKQDALARLVNDRAPIPGARWLTLSASALAVLALVAAYWTLHETGALSTIVDEKVLRARIENLGAWGPLAVIVLMMLAIVVSPIPSAPIAMAAGAAYGHGWGTLYVLTGAEAGALAAFGMARILGRAVLGRWFGERLSLGLHGSQGALMGIVFVSRLLPFISFDLISYAAGLTVLSFWRFALATLAGIAPASLFLAHLGREMTSGEAERFLYAALALGLLTAIPIVVKLVRNHVHRGHGRPR